MGRPNPRGSAPLPLAARRAAWDRLWRILLAPPVAETAGGRPELGPPPSAEDLEAGRPVGRRSIR